MRPYRFQTRILLGDYLNKNRHIFTRKFDDLKPSNDQIKFFCLFYEQVGRGALITRKWMSFDLFLYRLEILLVNILMDRYKAADIHYRSIPSLHHEIKSNIHDYITNELNFAFTEFGKYIAFSKITSESSTIKYQKPFFRVFKALHLISCCLNNHEIEKEIVEVRSCDQKKTIRLPIHRCLICGRQFLGQQTLEVYECEYGRLDFDFRYDNNWLDGCTITDSYDYEHNGESKLHQLGYNVIQNYYSEEYRHQILMNLLESEKITYFEICRDIEHAIRIFTNVSTHQEAVRKWREDLLFISDYVERKHYETFS